MDRCVSFCWYVRTRGGRGGATYAELREQRRQRRLAGQAARAISTRRARPARIAVRGVARGERRNQRRRVSDSNRRAAVHQDIHARVRRRQPEPSAIPDHDGGGCEPHLPFASPHTQTHACTARRTNSTGESTLRPLARRGREWGHHTPYSRRRRPRGTRFGCRTATRSTGTPARRRRTRWRSRWRPSSPKPTARRRLRGCSEATAGGGLRLESRAARLSRGRPRARRTARRWRPRVCRSIGWTVRVGCRGTTPVVVTYPRRLSEPPGSHTTLSTPPPPTRLWPPRCLFCDGQRVVYTPWSWLFSDLAQHAHTIVPVKKCDAPAMSGTPQHA